MTRNIRVMVVDDHPLMRRALVAAVETEFDLTVVGTATDGYEAQVLARELQPDVILMDLLMPGCGGIEAIEVILTWSPEVKILVVTSLEEDAEIIRAIQAGAVGYLTKATDTEELLNAIRLVYRGGSYLPDRIAARLMASVRNGIDDETPEAKTEDLTQREKEILKLLGQGYTNAQIGETLHISRSTVNVHLHNITNKLCLANRRELIAYAVNLWGNG